MANAALIREFARYLQGAGRDIRMALERAGIVLGGAGVTDHGALTGLADDDHPHYVKVAAGAFTTLAPTSTVASSAANDLTRLEDVNTAFGTFLVALEALFQPLHGNLTALAELTAAPDTIPYFDAADSMQLQALTSLARGLMGTESELGMREMLEVDIDPSVWTGTGGALDGETFTTVQALADWINDNFTPP